MTMTWVGYSVIELPFGGSRPRDLSRRQAREFFDWLMSVRAARIEQLRGLVESNGYPSGSDEDFRRSVVDFVNANVEAESVTPEMGYPIPASEADRFRVLTDIWHAVAMDVGLFIGSVLTDEIPTLRWELLVKGGKLNIGYHFPVIKGFKNGPWPDYYISPIDSALGAMTDAAYGKPMRPVDQWIETARQKA